MSTLNTPTRLAAFTAGLVVAFDAAWGVGNAVEPVLDEPTPVQDEMHDDGHDDKHEDGADHAE